MQQSSILLGEREHTKREREWNDLTGIWGQEYRKEEVRQTERQTEKERLEVSRALLKGNLVNVHSRYF